MMKYKKLRPIAIMPLWAKIVTWIISIPAITMFIMVLWLVASGVVNEMSKHPTTIDHVKLLFVPKNVFYGDDLIFVLFFLAILITILFPFIVVSIFYIGKFYLRNFKLSDIRNPQKYNPDDIRKYFPEYKSKTEKAANGYSSKQDDEEELKKAVDIINKQAQKLGKDKVMSIIEGLT